MKVLKLIVIGAMARFGCTREYRIGQCEAKLKYELELDPNRPAPRRVSDLTTAITNYCEALTDSDMEFDEDHAEYQCIANTWLELVWEYLF